MVLAMLSLRSRLGKIISLFPSHFTQSAHSSMSTTLLKALSNTLTLFSEVLYPRGVMRRLPFVAGWYKCLEGIMIVGDEVKGWYAAVKMERCG